MQFLLFGMHIIQFYKQKFSGDQLSIVYSVGGWNLSFPIGKLSRCQHGAGSTNQDCIVL